MNQDETRRRNRRPRKDRDQRRASVKRMVRFALDEALHPEARARILKEALWMATEIEFHKHKISLRTPEADAEILRGLPKLGSRVQHEHVYQRKWVIQQLLAEPERAEALLDEYAVACVVTKAQTEELKKHDALVGWERYKAAGLTVVEVQADGSLKPRVL